MSIQSGVFEAVRIIATSPIAAGYHALSKISPGTVLKRFIRLCETAGLTFPAFVLSFDCDTDKDIRVVGDVHKRLLDMGIMPVYAVPGKLIEQGANVYGGIAREGAEFINHGYSEHCHLLDDEKTYKSSFFYDQLSREIVKEDILLGDKAIREILGKNPKGFRTPHFGTFQSQNELRFLHNILIDLDYSFSTSTVPLAGVRWGLATRRFGLPEIPVTGCPGSPLRILDSWSFRYAPGRTVSEDDFIAYIYQMRSILEQGNPYLANIYVDPSQVYDWQDFFEAMEVMAPYNIPSYTQLLGNLKT